ncbi:MAG: HAD-IA family hydrolase [Betaproteobacteria bacterium]|nr:HAD-IA family hydrolase [Betaproteobacteria bacterium]MDE2132719.1 HAD-IA family hydrolase [Betaproteobacteria bacterium]MDE2211952.1 HAD-IA family hydrolase [Betaproteobacteria bacterium]
MIRGILFDLDGTLADSAPDLGWALNTLLDRYGRPPVALDRLRRRASQGARGLLEEGFGVRPEDPFFEELRDEFLTLYRDNLSRRTVLFEGVPELLASLDARGLPWGIVTNKLARFTGPLVEALGLAQRAACVVSGDSYARPKPYPDPLLGAAGELALAPAELLFVGDDERDMVAAQAAGMDGIVARYGYLGEGTPPETWHARGWIDHPRELMAFLSHDA